MRFSFVATALLSSAVVNAADILVKVGANNGLVFEPSNVTAKAGDTISFQFQGKNHSVTQSTFPSPCVRMASGVDSGFMPVASGAATLPQWSITVNNASAPLWFFCAQTNPVDHCQKGMVFAVNAPPAKPFSQFQATAMASGNSTASSSGNGTAVTPSATGSSSGTGGSVSGSSPSSAASTTPSSNTSGALKLGGSAAGALTAVALLVSFVL